MNTWREKSLNGKRTKDSENKNDNENQNDNNNQIVSAPTSCLSPRIPVTIDSRTVVAIPLQLQNFFYRFLKNKIKCKELVSIEMIMGKNRNK